MISNYRADVETSLSLAKDEVFHIMDSITRDREDCYVVRNSSGLEGVVPKRELGDFELPAWFQSVDRKAAEAFLKDAPPSKFIVRSTQHGREGEYSVSVRYPNGSGKPVRHFKLVCDPDSTCEWVMWGEKFRSLQDFVHFFQDTPIDKGNTGVTLDPEANVDRLEAGHPGYFDDQEYEEETDDEEPIPQGMVEGAQLVCVEPFEADEEGTLAARAGDRLLILFPPNQGWVYVRNTMGREGYLPEDCVDIC